MTTVSLSELAPDLSVDDYVVVGLATCFLKDDGEIHAVEIAEPIPSAALEAIAKGLPTSYKLAVATTLGQVVTEQGATLPGEFPATTQFCDEFIERAIAASRTYQKRAIAKEIIPVGTCREDWNYSLERKRVLNSENLVKPEDNVKQHAYTHQVL